MIELIQQYGLAYLFTDGNGFSGVAMTLWLFIISVVLGFILSIPLAIARVSEHFWIRWPVEVYTYLFRGTPLYIQLLICYTGLYGLDVVQDNALQPLTVSLPKFFGLYIKDWQYVFAVATVAIVPVVILFGFIEKRLIGGLTAGAVK